MIIFGLILLGIVWSFTTLLTAIFVGFRKAISWNAIAYPFLIICLSLIGWINSPTKLDRDDVIGHYVIDRDHYPGSNADWQHNHYTLEITGKEVIVRDYHLNQVWRHDMEWFTGPDYRWRFKNSDYTKRHHLVLNGPSLYRRSFSHSYVFKSSHYGNVFFVKR